MALAQPLQDRVVGGLERRHDEQAARAGELGPHACMVEDVVDLRGAVEGQLRPVGMHVGDQAGGVRRSVEEVRVAERDVAGSCGDELVDVCEHCVAVALGLQLLEPVREDATLAAEELQWSQINITARSSVLKGLISFNYNTTFDPYATNEMGRRINEFYFDTDGRLLRLERSQFNVSTSLSNRTFDFVSKGKENPAKQPVPAGFDPLNVESGFGAYTTGDPNYHLLNYYVDYTTTWNLRLNYVLTSQIRQNQAMITQTFDFSGDVQLTKSWRIGFSSGYDLKNEGFSYTSFDIYRDLHCWELTCRYIPFGPQQSYFLSLGVKAPMFKDLKLERQRGIGDFGQRF
jgi:hypothetical protein